MKQILMGNEAIAWGLIHANVDMVSGYPGTPSSEILASFQKIRDSLQVDAYAEWATNEKVGFEVAYAGAITGKRTCATMKQVGLNVASDALMSAAYIGNKGGMLLVSADDPGFHSSQTEQDSRTFAKFARIPVLDPATPQEAYDFAKMGVEISERFEIPVMLRPVMRVCHAREICDIDADNTFEPKVGNFERDIPRWAGVPRAGRFKQGEALLKLVDEIKAFNWKEFIKPQVQMLQGNKVLCLTSGTGDGYAREALRDLEVQADVIKFDMPSPLPEKELEKICAKYEKVIVFEETYPCIEEQISAPNLYGKLSGHAHVIDEFSKEKVLKTLENVGVYEGENIYQAPLFSEELPVRPPNLCPGCPHRDVYYSVMKVFKKKKAIYPSDIGCYTLGLNQGAIDTVLCMGGSVSMASGFSVADPDKTVVATIGDSTFLHSGVAPLINAVYQKHKFILLILDNSTTAMTGRQVTPERVNPAQVDILKVVQGCGAECHEYVFEPKLDTTVNFMKGLKKAYEKASGPVVAVVREFCVLDKERAPDMMAGQFAEVNEDECVACDRCTVDFKCPPMSYNADGKVQIDPFLCAGCASCLDDLCPTDAFVEVQK